MSINVQTGLNVLLGLLSAWLAYRNFTVTSRHDVQRESQEMAKIQVQLTQVMQMLGDLQKDVRSSNVDFRLLSERVAIMETNLSTAFQRIEELKAYHKPHEEK